MTDQNLINLPGETLRELQLKSGMTQSQFARKFGLNFQHLHSKISNAKQREIRNTGREYLKPSPYPVYDRPLEMTGDALVLPDPEFPYHHAPFMNHVLELAEKWNIRNCIIAGDVMHFNSISSWEASWKQPPDNGMTEAQEKRLLEFADKVQKRYRDEYVQAIVDCPHDNGGEDVGTEVDIARKELLRLGNLFDEIHYVIGNHDGRLLSALNSPMFADQLLQFVGLTDPKWKIAPYYFSVLHSGGETWRIEHPKSAAQNTAVQLASKYLCHVTMGHSHAWSHSFDMSGNYHAIQMGACVDERRLPYAAQRSTSGRQHKLGAMFVINGEPILLHDRSPWELYLSCNK